MKKFLLHIPYLISVFIILNLISYKFITYPQLYSDYESIEKELSSERIDYRTFIFSDSHGWRITHEKPEVKKYFDDHFIYNMSYGSDSYGDILVKLKWLLKNRIKLDTMLLTIDDHMLTKKSNNRNRSLIYSDATTHSTVYGASKIRYYYYHISKFLPLIYSSNQKLIAEYLKAKTFKAKNESTIEIKWSNFSLLEKKERIEKKIKSFFPKNKKQDKKLTENLKEIIEIASQNNIVVVGVKFPLDSMMTESIRRISKFENVKKVSKDFGLKYFMDFENRDNQSEYLTNQDHVNKLGAELISSEIVIGLQSLN